MIELGLDDSVSNRLKGIDSQLDGIESGAINTQSGFNDLGRATTEYGRVAGQEIEGVGKDITELDRQVEGHADITAKTADDVSKSWAKVGAAIGGVALATEAFVRSQQDYYVTAAKISQITGLERDEVVGLAVELTNISNSIDDAYGVMEVGARQGLRTRDELVAYVKVWDDIGTASGENAAELAEAAVSLRSVGIDARDLAESYDTLGFVMSHTTSSVSDFLRLTGYMARDMDLYGMSISDVAVTLAALEERGMGAADAKRALRSAMSSAKGDVTALYRELRITDEQLTRLNEEIKGGSDYITEMGDAYNESRSPLQYLQVEVTKISNLLGADLNPVIGVSSAVLSGLSTVLLTAATAKYIFADASIKALIPSLVKSTAAAWAFTASLLANPLTWVVVGVVALGAALYLLASNWDTVSGWFMDRWEQVGSVVTGAISWIGEAWDSTVGRLVAGAEWLMDHMGILAFLFPVTAPIAGMNLLRDNWDTVTGAIAGGWDWLVGAAQDGAAWLGETIGGALSGIIDLFWQ
ncbi:MAG TPA: phage tail tape measure protein, partial [Methanoculleus sp.]|nr:phage tail tape measure protein [Methanoculleus sp.]